MDTEAQFEASLEDEVDKSNLERYIEDVLCRVTSAQRKKLERIKTMPGPEGIVLIGSPVQLYDSNVYFPAYVQSRIDWANSTGEGQTLQVRRTKAVNAICKFHTPKFGWLDFKEAHEHTGDTKADRREARETKTGGDANEATGGSGSAEAYRRYLDHLQST